MELQLLFAIWTLLFRCFSPNRFAHLPLSRHEPAYILRVNWGSKRHGIDAFKVYAADSEEPK